jgi:hypothetical protein
MNHRVFRFFIDSLPALLFIPAASMTLIAFLGLSDSKIVDRTKLLADIEMAVNSGAELQDIRQIFENRKHVRLSIIKDIFRSSEAEDKAIYKEPVALNSVLKDLKADIFLRKEVNKELVQKIKAALAEYEKSNPFDKLESSQRIHFETIQSKLGDGYAHIQQDVNLIVDEMSNKNQLVAKYLGDATLSFRISVIALVVGVIAFIPQLAGVWRWWRRKTKGENSVT